MAQILVRNLPDHIKGALAVQALRNGVSLEEEVRRLLSRAVAENQLPLGERIASKFRGIGFDEPVAEFKHQTTKTPDFDE